MKRQQLNNIYCDTHKDAEVRQRKDKKGWYCPVCMAHEVRKLRQ